MAREGTTLVSHLPLRPGSNAAIAVAPESWMPYQAPEIRSQWLANDLAAAIGAPAELAGVRGDGWVFYVIGNARPAVFHALEPTDKRAAWYKRVGAPLGDVPVSYFAINIDWRGDPIDLSWPSTVFVVPSPLRTVHGAPNHADQTAEELRETLESESTAQWMSDLKTAIDEHVEAGLGVMATAWKIALGVAGLILGGFLVYQIARPKR
jgi:hypothetical protein